MVQQFLTYFLSPVVGLAVVVCSLIGLSRLLDRIMKDRPERNIHKPLILVMVSLLLIVCMVALLPISDSLRGQVLSLLGILLSASIALSATTFLGNALAGILLSNVSSFKIGDFIYINEYFGRVSGRGLFHLEIQTEDRDLLTLPNLYVSNNPVKVARNSGTVISTEVSLGYDVTRTDVEEVLLAAAHRAELEDPFVYLVSLSDFSVVYRLSGLLSDVKSILSARSRLNGQVVDGLHAAKIEIVSPHFMNTRNVETSTFIPKASVASQPQPLAKEPEDIVFDKAEQAETLEEQKQYLAELEQQIEALEGDLSAGDEQQQAQAKQRLARLTQRRDALSHQVSRDADELSSEKTVK